MWEQYNRYKSIHKQLAKVKPEKREQLEQRHSRELILYDAAARYCLLYTSLCPTQHRINESAVLTLVSDTLRASAEYSRNDRTEFIHTVQETQVCLLYKSGLV